MANRLSAISTSRGRMLLFACQTALGGAEFLRYQCKYGHTRIQPKQGVVALVLDAAKEFGVAAAVKIEPDGRQMAALRVASDDGGFLVMATTPTAKGDRLHPGDTVIWVPLEHTPSAVPPGTDPRFGWVGFIVAKVKPEVDLAKRDFDVTCFYDR